MADGTITIGTELSTSKFDKQIVNLEKKITKAEQKKLKIETEIEDIRKKTNDFNELIAKAEEYKRVVDKINEAQQERAVKGLKPFTLNAGAQQLVNEYAEMEKYINENASSMQKLADKGNLLIQEQKDLNNEVETYKSEIDNINLQKQVAETEKLKDSFNNVNNSLQDVLKKAGKLVLGIFAIRSAYMAIRRASSDLSSYDQQYAANLEYIRFVLTQAIAPVLRWITNMAMKLLQIINMIVNALFGVNLFSNGSAENFKKMKSGASGVGKAVKEIKKQLMGFDEINVLTSQSDSGTSAGAGGVGIPSMDLSKAFGEEPWWIKWIRDNKEMVLGFLAGIVTYLTLIKLGLDPIKSLGIGLMVWGIVDAVMSLIDYLKDPTWENFGSIIQGIGIFVIGLGVAFLGLPAIITGVIVLIVGTIIKYWDKIQTFLQNGIDWLKDKSEWVREVFGENVGLIYDFWVNTFQRILDWAGDVFSGLKQIFDGFIQFLKGVFTGNWEDIWQGLGKIVSGVFNIIKSTLKNGLMTLFDYAVTIASVAGNAIAFVFKSVVNAILGAIERILNKPISAINGLIGVVNSIPGVKLSKLNTFKLPRLKSGAILNMPNKGTLVGGGTAIAGEAGYEGYLPLTDQQAMAELGRQIGKNVFVNLTNITSMNGRVINRELKSIQSEQDFAYNT